MNMAPTKYLQQNIKEEYDTKSEQVDASVRFVLAEKPDYYESLKNLPSRVTAALLTMIADWSEPTGYHFAVLRAAHRQFSRDTGYIESHERPFTDEELFGN